MVEMVDFNELCKCLDRPYVFLRSSSIVQVSDWWEKFIYLRGRSPIMVNSNFYGLVCICFHWKALFVFGNLFTRMLFMFVQRRFKQHVQRI